MMPKKRSHEMHASGRRGLLTLTYSFGNIITMRTTAKHMQGKASSVILRPRRRITIDVPNSEKPKDIVFVTCV